MFTYIFTILASSLLKSHLCCILLCNEIMYILQQQMELPDKKKSIDR